MRVFLVYIFAIKRAFTATTLQPELFGRIQALLLSLGHRAVIMIRHHVGVAFTATKDGLRTSLYSLSSPFSLYGKLLEGHMKFHKVAAAYSGSSAAVRRGGVFELVPVLCEGAQLRPIDVGFTGNFRRWCCFCLDLCICSWE
jgi:hypothetical protein